VLIAIGCSIGNDRYRLSYIGHEQGCVPHTRSGFGRWLLAATAYCVWDFGGTYHVSLLFSLARTSCRFWISMGHSS
jgi:hypothetical protein